MSKRILIGGALVVAVVLGLASPSALAKKGGGGKPPPDNPTGTVYYTLNGLPQLYTMNADGSGNESLATGVRGGPSDGLHGGQRWFLYYDDVSPPRAGLRAGRIRLETRERFLAWRHSGFKTTQQGGRACRRRHAMPLGGGDHTSRPRVGRHSRPSSGIMSPPMASRSCLKRSP